METGYRSGGFSLAFGYETYAPEFITAYTIGSKNRFFDNRVQLNIEGFYWKYSDQQLTGGGLDRNGNPGFYTRNVGQSTIKGVEVEAQFLATDTTLINATVQYTDAVYDSFVYFQPGTVPGGNVLVNCPQTAVGAEFRVDCSGKPAFNAPEWIVNLGVQQTVPLGSVKLVGAIDTQFKTERFTALQYLDPQLTPSSWTTNAQLTLAAEDDRWSITGFVRNIENERVLTGSQQFAATNALTGVYTAPRTYGIRGNIKF